MSVTLAGVKKETTVQNGGTFSALFERAIIPVGEQNISITTLDGKQIYSGTISTMTIKTKIPFTADGYIFTEKD